MRFLENGGVVERFVAAHPESEGVADEDLFGTFACKKASPGIAVGTAIADRPPHRSVREVLPHTAPAASRAGKRSFGYGWRIFGCGR